MRKGICSVIVATALVALLAVPSSAWKFVSMADSRGSTNGVNTTTLTTIVNLVNAENVEFVLFQGDAVNGSSSDATTSSQMDTWLSIINTLNCPWYWTPGNHEVNTATAEAMLRTKVDQPLNGPAGQEEMVYSFDHKEGHFAALNSDSYGQQHHVQRSWLTTDLANVNAPHIFVMAHDPAYPAGPHVGGSLDAYPSERNDLWNIMTSKKVSMFFCGHEHLYQRSLQGSIYQVINGTCGAPIYGGVAGTIAQYHYVVVSINGVNVHCEARNDSGALIDSWDYTVTPVTPVVTSPAIGATVATTTPTIQWAGPAHDAYQVRVTKSNDPNVMVGGWDSGVVSSSVSSVVCGSLDNLTLYNVFVRVHNGPSWTPWGPISHNFAVNTSAGTATVYGGDTLPSGSGWVVYDTTSYENSSSIASAVFSDGLDLAWRLNDKSTANRCKMKYPVSSISFDTGASVDARIRAVGVTGTSTQNLGISKVGAGAIFVKVSPTTIYMLDRNGFTKGSYSLDGTVYRDYRLTVRNATPGNNATATWKLYIDGILRITWTGTSQDNGFDGFMAGQGAAAATGAWYFDWIAGRADGDFAPWQWSPVSSTDVTPPGPVSNLKAASGDAQIDLAWTNPADSDFSGSLVLCKTSGYPSSPTDGTAIYDGTATSFSHAGIANGTRYYYSVFAHDSSNCSSSATVATMHALEAGIQEAKELANNEARAIKGKTVSAAFTDCFYIQDPGLNQFYGIKVVTTDSVTPGSSVDVVGLMGGADAERFVDCTGNYIVAASGPGVPAPFAMSGRAVGGASLNWLTPGVADGIGPNNVGLYIRIWGKTSGAASTTFRISDGSTLSDATPMNILVTAPASLVPADDSYVLVTGVSSLGESLERKVIAESVNGVVVLQGP